MSKKDPEQVHARQQADLLLKFPSGMTVAEAKQRAKTMVANMGCKHSEALDLIAKNELGKNWGGALHILREGEVK